MRNYILLAIALLFGCLTNNNPTASEHPPLPKLRSESNEIEVFQSTYCWFSLQFGKCVDYVSPDEQLKDQMPTIVSPEEEITIIFSYKPKEGTLHLSQWKQGEPVNILIDENKFKVPAEQGEYIYILRGNWEEGDSSYVFKLKVAD